MTTELAGAVCLDIEEQTQVWLVRAGEQARYIDTFLDSSVVTIGLSAGLGETALLLDREELIARTAAANPGWSHARTINQASQLARFVHEMAVGDEVATYDAERRIYVIGRITSGPRYDETLTPDQPYVRDVEWLRHTSRDILSVSTRNTLGCTLGLFRLQGAPAVELRGFAVPIGDAVRTAAPSVAECAPAEERSLDELRNEVRERATEFIEDAIASLAWDELQELVAGLLRAMGYKTRVSPMGGDRGVDVFASPDGLGLEEPRIFVEVKHQRQTAMGAAELRAFLGGRKAGDRCLYVSTGGFTKEARYEADRSAIPLRLVGLRELQELLVERYDAMDMEARRLVPLAKVYWPVAES